MQVMRRLTAEIVELQHIELSTSSPLLSYQSYLQVFLQKQSFIVVLNRYHK